MIFSLKKYKTKSGEIRERNRVQCIRLHHDDLSPSGQARRQVVITLDRWAIELPPEAKHTLTEEEQAEWAEWKAKHDEHHQRELEIEALHNLPIQLEMAAQALVDGAALEDSNRLWAALDTVSSALRKSGYPKSKKTRVQ